MLKIDFRFEVLGCRINQRHFDSLRSSFVPDIDFSSEPLPSGFLSARWSDPSVVIAGRETVYLNDADNFLVTASNGETSEFRNGFISQVSLIYIWIFVKFDCISGQKIA